MTLSIVTVAYNNIDGLKNTANSIFEQTFTDYEWIVIDGGSNDGTCEYLESLERQPDFWISERDSGIYDAMNKGISHSTSTWLLFLNSGDSLSGPDVLEKVFSKMPNADIVYGDATFRDINNTYNVVYPEPLTLDFFMERCICHQATFIKREILVDSKGYSTDYKIVSDWRAWIVWMIQGKKFVHLPIIVCVFILDGVGSTKLEEARIEREKVLEEVIPEYVKPLLVKEIYVADLEYYLGKLHVQFLNKPLIRASIVLSRSNWLVRKTMRVLISIGCAFDRVFYGKNHCIKYSDDKYDASHPETFKFRKLN